jgi:phosphoribosylglycinamide formyltransferase-1
MKFGVICSARGSAFASALDILFEAGLCGPSDVVLVTDRPCGAEQEAGKRGVEWQRYEYPDPDSFSRDACSAFRAFGCELAFMLYSRRVTGELFLQMPTLNIHPALLPAFPGLNAPDQARAAGVRFLGATLHNVTDEMDGGPILAQVSTPVQPDYSEADYGRISFIQKTYLMVCALDMYSNGSLEINPDNQQMHWTRQMPASSSANPRMMTESLIDAFSNIQSELGWQAIEP